MGRKVSDEFAVPLCRTHHRQLHRTGNEINWWNAVDSTVDPLKIARHLWERTRDGRHVTEPEGNDNQAKAGQVRTSIVP